MDALELLRERLANDPELVPISEERVRSLADQHPGLPEEYLAFLTQIGWGMCERIALYGGTLDPDEVYSAARRGLERIILFGDDMQGYVYGFDTNADYAIVEVDPRGGVRRLAEPDFLSFMVERTAPDELND